ncbi:DNA repair family protein [Acanthamoeba castellanii str. Neff]|uniref:DNA repair family protein n=1 Tax=Acanthamoeba castellanii (strain ATCC 30010 / Neff) TaxID=1257118 RepID=L8GI48_ACACF|nr:DNA repair family protein [Acanthamoeba castellanii str. Neff]ELR12433.1 DNA repair family protein [Acanthamoeba castellanii str. Neff]
MTVHPMTDTLQEITNLVNAKCGRTFDVLLLNFYKDGSDYISLHSDDETSIDRTAIASLSLGASRIFRLKQKGAKGIDRVDFLLESGDLLLMKDKCQDDLKHTVPKSSKVTEGRINLTFRVSRA